MGSRVLSLWLPYLATDRIRRDQLASETKGRAYATFRTIEGHSRLFDLCPLAEHTHLRRDMTLADARSILPALSAMPWDKQGDHRLLETLKTWCERYTSWVAIDQSHQENKGYALWLDVSQAAHHFGGEEALIDDLLQGLFKQGLQAKAAIADTPGTAWAMTRFGRDEHRVLPIKGAQAALGSLPIAALRLTDEQVTRLQATEVNRIDELYAFSRQKLEAQFGRPVVNRLDQALGLIDEPMAPNAPLPAQQAQMIFAEPVVTIEALRLSIERLVRQLSVGLEAAGLGAKRLTLALYWTDRSAVTYSIGSGRPSRHVKRLTRQLIDEVMTVDLSIGIERLILDAVEIEPLLPETIAWRGLGTDGADPVRDLAQQVEWGKRSKPDAHRACKTGHVLPMNRRPATYGNLATALKLEPLPDDEPETVPASKSLRLLRQPEPIEAIAPVPDEPPILFRWRRGLHKVVRAQGPERIAPEWWRIPDHEQPSIHHEISSRIEEERRLREYFAVEDSTGDRFWLFRQGLYQSSQTTLPTWYLHGVFD